MVRITQFCRVVAGEVVRDGLTANCLFTFEIIGDATRSPGVRFHSVLPVTERFGQAHMLFLAIAMRHMLRVDMDIGDDGVARFLPRYGDLLPIFLRGLGPPDQVQRLVRSLGMTVD